VRTKIIPVVAACIMVPAGKGFHETRFLLHKKNEVRNKELLGKWEFPGGMMDYGEDPEYALRREIREELGKEIIIGRLIHAQTNIYKDGKHYLVLFYRCYLAERLPDIDGCAWFSWTELAELDALPGLLEAAEACILIKKA